MAAELSDANHQQPWVPVGFAHSFLTLSERAEVLYKASGTWPLAQIGGSEPLLAAKDAAAPSFEQAVAAGEVLA